MKKQKDTSKGAQRYVAGEKPRDSKLLDTEIGRLVPGLALSLVAAGLAYVIAGFLPTVSPLLVAIVLGILVTNLVRLPASTAPGTSFSAKKLLRVGIVLLGLKLALSDIWALGLPMLLVIVAVVVIGMFGTVLLGRMLRVPKHLTTLIACGFSICGAAAVAGAVGVTDPDDEDESSTVTAIALVVIFGTLMIGVMPLLVDALHMPPTEAGMWTGASVHEVAQVVAVGDIIGGGALTVAVIVKLGRVLLLAPVMVVLSLLVRRQKRQASGSSETAGKLPPLVPLFIVGFLVMVLIASFVPLPQVVFDVAAVIQTVCLAAAMFALGLGVKVKALKEVGARPFVLGALVTVLVTAVAYVGVMLVAGGAV